MSLFLSLLSKLFPLYATMGAGAVLSRRSGDIVTGLATLQIFLIAPVVVFANIVKLQIVPEMVALPVLYYILSVGISAALYHGARAFGSDYAPVLGQAGGAANTGYLGVPIAMILFPADWLPLYFFVTIGGIFYENTFGYYWIARGTFSARDAIKSLLKLPTVYALIAAVTLNRLGFVLPESMDNIIRDFMGAYVVLGALIVGFAIARNKTLSFNPKILGVFLSVKFLLWPLMMFGVLALARVLSLGLTQQAEHILLLISFLPIAANSAAYAALLNVHPEDAAAAVAVSTLLSLALVPAYALFFGLVQ